MIKSIKNTSVKLSLVAMLAIPSMGYAASGAGFIDGSSESSSAYLENPSFEAQIARINVGINLVRLNTDIIERMPISADAQWVDKVSHVMTTDMYKETIHSDVIKNDPYYSTVLLTNVILRRPALSVSPLTARMFYEANTIYKNPTNGYKGYHIPNMSEFPSVKNLKSYVTFKEDPKVAIIDVEASKSKRYSDVVKATIALLPDGLQEDVNSAKKDYVEQKKVYEKALQATKDREAWLDDDKNAHDPQYATKKEELKTLQADQDAKEAVMDKKEEAYYMLLDSGAEAIASNFDESKVPLAKKLEKLLDTVDNNAIGAGSMFVSASVGMLKGYGELQKELKAIVAAQALTTLVGNQKEFLIERYKRMGIGALMAIPNIAIGTYYATSQSSEVGHYQGIVDSVLEAGKVAQEAKEAEKKANK
jgi:hypothetical protein